MRVANLEKKTDNVKITGQIRASYKDADNGGNEGRLRTRLFLNGQVNEDWTYTGRFENNQYYTNDDNDDDDVDLNWAYVSGRLGGIKVEAGRQDFVKADVMDNRGDGIKLSYGDKIKVFGWAMKANSDDWVNGSNIFGDTAVDDGDRVYVAGVESKIGVIGADLRYYNADNARENEIWEVSVNGDIAKDLNLKGSYFYGDSDTFDGDDSGWLVGLSYRGAKASEPGSWGVYANYSDRPLATFLNPTLFSGGYGEYPFGTLQEAIDADGYEGFDVGANVTLAKNIVAGVKYVDVDCREDGDDEQTIWSELVFTF